MLRKQLTLVRVAPLLLLCSFFLLKQLYNWDLAYPGILLPSTSKRQPQLVPTALQALSEKTEATEKSHYKHPAYHKRCYHYYQNLTIKNTCCPLHNFTNDMETLHTCIRRANEKLSGSSRWVILPTVFTQSYLKKLSNRQSECMVSCYFY